MVKAEARPQRDIVSFVRRSARMNPSQERAWRDHRDAYLVEVDRGPMSADELAWMRRVGDAIYGKPRLA